MRIFRIFVHGSIVPKSTYWNMVYLVLLSGIYYFQAMKVLASVGHSEKNNHKFLDYRQTNYTTIAKLVTMSIGTLILLFKS